ncbi:hypothetical protein BU26DRAFT_524390 [Trematosphaeria pertusa]|uniref:MYND-type domain-containing protein n=1 Tax=Trematosphaeria pertusa TaxID=390896 RepID=A0A6A6HVW7_9PLEO|nr:uncharacterized protein BU26DRAFT_524390 [Trematosphaeria pertusa]KAF2242197.1 hypothetical protein BU26DRAFT_524390 [Trematosphaeria pertusa]
MPPKSPNSTLFKCATCGRVPNAGEEGLMLCGQCKGRRYCDETCRSADWTNHKSDCNTVVLLAKPKPTSYMADFVKARDPDSTARAKDPDTMYHLKMTTPWARSRARYLGAFINLEGVQAKIQDTVEDLNSVVPSPAFLSGLLDSPRHGLGGVQELRIPLVGLDKCVKFQIKLENNPYIKYCVRSGAWSAQKALYTVVVETLELRKNTTNGVEERYIADIEVDATFASAVVANDRVKAVAKKWKDKRPGRVELRQKGQDHTTGVAYDKAMGGEKVRCVSIVTKLLMQAGAVDGAEAQGGDRPPKRKLVAPTLPSKRLRIGED